MKTKILVVDDDPTILKVLEGYLIQAGYEVISAPNGQMAMRMLRHEKINLLVLDLMLPDQDGWEITRWIRRDHALANLPIIMLTAMADDMDKILGLELGADDYVTKPFNSREMVARVRAVLRRYSVDNEPHHVLQLDHISLDTKFRELHVKGKRVDLTPTEYNLIVTLMENINFTFTRDELVERGMGYGYEGVGRALDTHIKNLRQKLENPAYIETVYGVGYRFVRDKNPT